METAVHLAVRNQCTRIFSQLGNSQFSSCELVGRDGVVRTDVVLMVAALPNISSLLCGECVGVQQRVTFLLPNYSKSELETAVSSLLVFGDVSFLQQILMDSPASRYSGEIRQTNQDILLIKTEDEFETEALDNDADDGDDTLAEEDDFISTQDFQAPPYKIEDIANEKSDDSLDIGKEFEEKTEKVERRRGPDHSWSEVATGRV